MFICKGCHSKTDCKSLHIFSSYGPCEVCGKNAECYDCRPIVAHKGRRVV